MTSHLQRIHSCYHGGRGMLGQCGSDMYKTNSELAFGDHSTRRTRSKIVRWLSTSRGIVFKDAAGETNEGITFFRTAYSSLKLDNIVFHDQKIRKLVAPEQRGILQNKMQCAGWRWCILTSLTMLIKGCRQRVGTNIPTNAKHAVG